MADPSPDQVTVMALLLFAVAFGVLAYLELRFLRKRMKNRRIRASKPDEELEDEAHNAVVTTKAILAAMERQGIRSEESNSWLREAEMASTRRNYRVAIDLTAKAKDRLLSLKAAQASKGDLAKLDRLASSGGQDEVTTKELLQKEFPPNMVQSKFSIDLAGTSIETGGAAGRDMTQASQLLEAARAHYEEKDYPAALTLARQAKRASDGESIDPSAAIATVSSSPKGSGLTCPSCGASLHADDAFCRKCGKPIAQ